MKIRSASNLFGVVFALALGVPALVSCATTSSGGGLGGYGYGGGGGSAGNYGTVGCSQSPDCNSCQGSCAACMCGANGNAQACAGACNTGTGGSGTGGGTGTGGSTNTPACCATNSCTTCFEQCECAGTAPATCVTQCNSGTGGSGTGGSGTGGSGTGGSGFGGSGFGGSGTGGSGFGGSGFGGSGTGGSGTGGSSGSTGCSSQLVGLTCQQLGTGNQTCDSCMQSSCCTQMNTCFGDQECAYLYNCIGTSCAGISDQTQFNTCVTNNCQNCLGQTAQQELSDFLNCQQNSCGTQCQ